MRIDVRGIQHYKVTDEDRSAVRDRFARISKQAEPVSTLDVELYEEANPRIVDKMVCEATLSLKGETIRAKEAHPEMIHAIHHAAEDVRRQVKRHYEKIRGR